MYHAEDFEVATIAKWAQLLGYQEVFWSLYIVYDSNVNEKDFNSVHAFFKSYQPIIYGKLKIFHYEKFVNRYIPTSNIEQVEDFLRQLIGFLSHVYAHSAVKIE